MSRLLNGLTGAFLTGTLLGMLTAPFSRAAEDKGSTDPAAVEFFEKKVRPVLVEQCYKCHSDKTPEPKGGLRVDSRAALLEGGDSGPALEPGQPGKSRLIKALAYTDADLRMPPKGKLPDAVIADLTAWVKQGAAWPAGDTTKGVIARAAFDLAKRKREHWSWQPIRSPSPPAVKDRAWVRSASDAFILARLEDKGLRPAPAADRRTLLRRLSFDLIGLPPTPAEIDAFVHDTAPDAVEQVVDRLLASPHFGERWARHWMDLVRYAETRGHEFDYPAPNAYQYRDYLIRAFNADLPYNQFVTEHLAGDLLDRPRMHPAEGFNESILGTGFWFLGEEVHSPVDVRQDEADRFDNRIDVLSKTFLGLTVSCARCHDHKFDAISTKDYYALYGFLKSSSYRLVRFDSLEHNRRIAADLHELRQRARPMVQRALVEAARPRLDRMADYLLATRAVLQAGPGADAQDRRRKLTEIAQSRKLDPVVLEQWTAYLSIVVRDEREPLHAWAKAAHDPAAGEPARLAELLRPIVENARRRSADFTTGKDAEVIIDYARSRAADWLPDDVSFGPAPVRPGEVRWGSDPARPIVQVFDYAAAEKDRTWNGLKLAPGSETDPGRVSSLPRPGRTIRTPTFRVSHGKVFYLVKGVGQAYAAVDAHVLINGPLHSRLVLPLKGNDRFQWVTHDLTPYKGNFAHIEFTAADGQDFAVAMVVQAPQAPAAVDRSNRLLVQLLTEEAGSLEKLAAGYQRLLARTADRLAEDKIIGSADAADDATLANWLVQRPELFRAGDAVEAAKPILSEQAKLMAQIKHESHLAMAMCDGSGADEYVFIRGSHKTPGEVVGRRFLEALAGSARLPTTPGSGRLDLARQMTDPTVNPFLTRVLVNRVWHHLFGRGIVASTDNFGVMGEAPSHPELLDYLATEFVKEGWSVKRLIRRLVLSNAYRMSSEADGGAEQADPQNVLLHRMNLRRLEGEAIRDAMLMVSGRLDRKMYGPSVPVFLTEFQEGRGRPGSGPLDGNGRRSLYIAVRRNFLSPLMLAFDTPIPFSTVGRRTVSNVPAQALILMNDPLVHQQAELWARRVLGEKGSARDRIEAMYESAFARSPTDMEMHRCLEFLERQTKLAGAKPDDGRVWADLAHVLFNVKEFIFLK